MIMLGFNTTMSGKTINRPNGKFSGCRQPIPFSFSKQIYHREEIQRLDQEMVSEDKEPVILLTPKRSYHREETTGNKVYSWKNREPCSFEITTVF
jgi:hypothetical protein